MAQWKRAGPITQRSVDRNYALLVDFFNFVHSDWICQSGALRCCLLAALVPLAQRIARWTSNPKVLGSIPRWDEHLFLELCQFPTVRMAEWSKAPDSRCAILAP